MNKPKMIMMCGLPASGKSTYSKELSEKYNATVFSSDALREELFGDINEQSRDQELFAELHKRIKDCLKNNQNAIYDACNRSYKRRMAFLDELKKIPCEKICVIMATPFERCLVNNANRDRTIPCYVIERMYKGFDVPFVYEGWDYIEVVYSNEEYKNYYGTVNDFLRRYDAYNQENSHHQLTLGEHCHKAWDYVCTIQKPWDTHKNSVRTATVLHDCGKPFCKTFKNSKGEITDQAHYYDHQCCGSYNSFFYDIDDEHLYVATLIRWHMQPYFMSTEKSINKYRKLWGEELYTNIMLLHESDKAAH